MGRPATAVSRRTALPGRSVWLVADEDRHSADRYTAADRVKAAPDIRAVIAYWVDALLIGKPPRYSGTPSENAEQPPAVTKVTLSTTIRSQVLELGSVPRPDCNRDQVCRSRGNDRVYIDDQTEVDVHGP